MRESKFRDFPALERAKKIVSWLSPVSTIKLYKYPGILVTVSFPPSAVFKVESHHLLECCIRGPVVGDVLHSYSDPTSSQS